MASQFNDMTPSSSFFNVEVFFLPGFVTGPSLISISWLARELWHFSFIKNGPEIRNSESPPSEFCPISGDWGKIGITKQKQKVYWILQNTSVTVFKGTPTGRVKLPPPRLGLKKGMQFFTLAKIITRQP